MGFPFHSNPTRIILVSWQNRIPCVIQILRNFFSALKNLPALKFAGCLKLRGQFFEEKKFTKLWALDELFELPLLIFNIVIIHNGKFIHNLIDNKKISTTMGSNTGFVGQNPIRKGKIRTS